jgi:tripartite-type tricarboxylate transporter receptor subunit TctC
MQAHTRTSGALVLLLGAFALAPLAHSATWPEKPVRIIIPWPPGGSTDIVGRLLSVELSSRLKQQVIIDNRSGAGGNIGAEIAAKSPADGYTILFAFLGTHAINPSIYSKMPFQENDFTPIIWNASSPLILVVHPSLPAKSVPELIAIANSRPDQLIYGSTGAGAHNHLAAELFKMMTHTRMVHVPYKGGGPAAIALLSGEVAVLFAEPATIVEHVKSGKARALAVSSGKRSITLPNLPTIADSGVPGYDVTSWNGMLAPARTPPEIIRRLNAEFNKAISAPDIRERMLANGFEPIGGPPERFGELIHNETLKWATVVKAAGMKVD